MKKSVLATLLGTALVATPVWAQEIGPTPYLSFADSPFAGLAFVPGDFYLEDVEDGLINTPGLVVTGSGLCVTNEAGCFLGTLIDSVGNGGNETVGHSIFANGNAGPITITFDAGVLGYLPTAAGLVWTDGANPITFEAFDQNGVSLGILVGNHADGSNSGTTDEDRFYGAINPGGISRLTIIDPAGIEIDHIQYGLLAQIEGVPEPSTWAMILFGFGAIGCVLRRRRRQLLGA